MSKNKDTFYVDVQILHPGVTGSCIYLKIRRGNSVEKGIIDFGSFQERKYSYLNDVIPFDPKELDWVLITHIHADHIGRLPALYENGYNGKVYMSSLSKEFIGPALYDNMHVINDQRKRNRLGQLYGAGAVEQTTNNIVGCKYGTLIHLNEYTYVTFIPNGHLVGASMILLQFYYPGNDPMNFLFTGDYNSKNMFFPVPPVKGWIRELPITIITESTYGLMDSSEIHPVFKDNISQAVAEGKSCLCLAFSLGRFQEIMYILKDMQDHEQIPKDIPIFLDGKLAIKDIRLYKDLIDKGIFNVYPELKSFIPESSIFVSDKLVRRSVISDETQKIVIATSGMGSYGPAQTYIPSFIKNPNWLIHFTGYCTEGTLGNRLMTTPKDEPVSVAGLISTKEADVKFTNEFTAHAKRDVLLRNIKQFYHPNLVLVNHGEPDVKLKFAEYLSKNLRNVNVGVLNPLQAFRIDNYGFVKTIASDFDPLIYEISGVEENDED